MRMRMRNEVVINVLVIYAFASQTHNSLLDSFYLILLSLLLFSKYHKHHVKVGGCTLQLLL